MEYSVFLAKIFGIFLVIVSLAFLVNKGLLKTLLKVFKNKIIIFISGLASLLVGIFLVLSHNYWTGDWRTLITIFGWAAVLKGIIRIFWPELTLKVLKKLEKGDLQRYLLYAAFILGLYLLYAGLTS